MGVSKSTFGGGPAHGAGYTHRFCKAELRRPSSVGTLEIKFSDRKLS